MAGYLEQSKEQGAVRVVVAQVLLDAFHRGDPRRNLIQISDDDISENAVIRVYDGTMEREVMPVMMEMMMMTIMIGYRQMAAWR